MGDNHLIETLELSEGQKQEILFLWNREYPKQLQHSKPDEFDNYLSQLIPKKHYLIQTKLKEIKGWLFLFKRGNKNWFAMILDRSIQGRGYGSLLLKKIQESEISLSGWVIDHNNDQKRDGEFYQSPLNFYLKNGFRIDKEQRLETDKISAVKIVWENKQE